jgi:transcriptional regulator with XRE-family HTH domain/quercetin dioxygenase-like cupin family protein
MMDPKAREHIRAARKSRGMSLRELARRVGVSASLLSQIENGHSDPSVSTLYALVSVLELSLDVLLESGKGVASAPSSTKPTDAERNDSTTSWGDPATSPVVHPGERRVLNMDSGVVWERLTRGPSAVADALLVTYAPGGTSSSTGELMRHSGLEFAYLFEGQLTLQLGFELHAIHAGDSLTFDASTPHLYYNAGDLTAKGLWYVQGKETVPTQPGMRHLMAPLALVSHRMPQSAPTSAVEVLRAFSED